MIYMLRNLLHIPYFIYVCLWFVVLILASFPITLLLLLFPQKIRDTGMFYLMKLISNAWFIVTGMIPLNYNRGKVDFTQSYIITPNHQSFLDAAIIYTSIPHVFKTLGKKEVERTPVYGVIYKTVVITVDRSSMNARALSFRKMKQELDHGNSIVLFPEGTFTDQPHHDLLPFQDGAFSLAIQTQKNVLPLLFLDTAQRVHPSRLIRMTPGLNRAVYLPPVSCEGFEKKQVDSLKNYTHAYMQACLEHCRQVDVRSVWNYALAWQHKHPMS